MKRYIKPTTQEFEYHLESQLLNISGQAGDENLKGDSNGEYTSEGGINLGSRRNNVWDEEEEEDY